ncbi:hypothetical protein Pcinc_007966 [Petrolisthes cinctipes]|uniref:Uncharacterized protein n=1 Tax=Petrolisthes cinctipes TaxID=88211 RepID=A0AAE1G9Y0_PETCI|nr:hypothetical protein Pcinc_007966 [Petrolisthes cinctipes]
MSPISQPMGVELVYRSDIPSPSQSASRLCPLPRTPPPHYNTRHHLTTIIPDTPTPPQYQTPPIVHQDTPTPPQYQTPPIVHQDTPTPQQYQTPPIVHQDTPTPQQYQTPPHHNNTRHPHTTTIPDATCG